MKINNIEISVTQVIANQEIKTQLSASLNDKDSIEEASKELYLKCLNNLMILADTILKK